MEIIRGGQFDHIIDFVVKPKSKRVQQMAQQLARTYVDHVKNIVSEAYALKIGEVDDSSEDFAWQIEIRAPGYLHFDTNGRPKKDLTMRPLGDIDLWLKELRQRYEMDRMAANTLPALQDQDYAGELRIQLAMYPAPDTTHGRESDFAHAILATLYLDWMLTLQTCFKDWQMMPKDNPEIKGPYVVEKF